jgi:hypothetical protein
MGKRDLSFNVYGEKAVAEDYFHWSPDPILQALIRATALFYRFYNGIKGVP